MNPILRFTLLAYAITWLAVLPLVLQTLGIVSLGIPGYWDSVGALGPVAAAYAMRRSRDPRRRLRDLYGKQGSGGVGPAWTAALVLTPVVFLGIALVAAAVVDGSPAGLVPRQQLASATRLADLVIASVLFGFGEEPGWRGWLLPRLQARTNALRGTLILAVIWAGWHTPFLARSFQLHGAGALIGFYVSLLAGAFWLSFLFNSTGGSVLAAVLWHMLWNAATLIAMPSDTATMVLNRLLLVLGFGVALVWGRRGLSAVAPAAPGRRPPPARGRP